MRPADRPRGPAPRVAAAVGGRLDGPDVTVDGASHDSRAGRAAASCSSPSSPSATATSSSAPRWRPGRGRLPHARGRGARRRHARSWSTTPRAPCRPLGRLRPRPAAASPGRRGHRLGRQDVGEGPARRGAAPRGWRTAASAAVVQQRARRARSRCSTPPDGTEAVVVEMGARGLGHIADAVRDRPPDRRRRHRASRPCTPRRSASIDDVAEAKGELVEALPGRRHRGPQRRRPAGGGHGGPHRGRRAHLRRRAATCAAEGVALDDELRPTFRARARRGARRGRASACAGSPPGRERAGRGGRRAGRRRRRSTTSSPAWRRGAAVAAGGWSSTTLAGGRPRPQRRLQRQPDVGGRRPATRWPPCRPAPRRGARRDGRARRPTSDADHAAVGDRARELGIRGRRRGGAGLRRRGRRRRRRGRRGPRRRSATATPSSSRAAGSPASNASPPPSPESASAGGPGPALRRRGGRSGRAGLGVGRRPRRGRRTAASAERDDGAGQHDRGDRRGLDERPAIRLPIGTVPPKPMIHSAMTRPRSWSSRRCWSTVDSDVMTAK